MCGFVFSIGSVSKNHLINATKSIAHRGPDFQQFYFHKDNNILIGHQRLTILDEKFGSQPYFSEDKNLVLLFNGEIYNQIYLRKELEQKNINFLSKNSDTELVLKSFQAYGMSAFKKFDGQFSILIYNFKKEEIILARDQFGEKPLYYYYDQNTFIAGSELRIFKYFENINLKVNSSSLQKYFLFSFIPAPHTLYKNIYKLEKSHTCIIDLKKKKIKKEQYFNFLSFNFSNENKSYNDTLDELDYLLDKSVKNRLNSDFKLGLLLSGGIDSALISYYAKKNSKKEIESYSISIEEESFDEKLKARNFSNYLKINNFTTYLNQNIFDERYFKILELLDEPIGAPTFLPMYLVSELSKKNVCKSVLCGDGGDELFGGYEVFKFSSMFDFINILVNSRTSSLFDMLLKLIPISNHNLSLDFKLRRLIRGLSVKKEYRNTMFLSALSITDLQSLFSEKIELDELFSPILKFNNDIKILNSYDQTLAYYIEFYLPDLVCARADRAGMLNSVEIRSPFLNVEILKLAMELPLKYKANFFETKKILRDLLKRKVPNEFVDPGKLGFTFPMQKWNSVNHKYFFETLSYDVIEKFKHKQITKKKDYRNFFHCLNVLSQFDV